MPAISITDLNNAKLDVDHLAAVATSTALTVADRLGNTKRTLAGLRDQYPNAEPAAATATTQAGIATTQAGLAATAKTQAEAARDAANTSGKVFTSAEGTAAGIAATTTGQNFSVLSADSASWAIWRNNSGAALLIGPGNYTKAYLDSILLVINDRSGYIFTLEDKNKNVWLGLRNTGKIDVGPVADVVPLLQSLVTLVALMPGAANIAASIKTSNERDGLLWYVGDGANNVPVRVDRLGDFWIKNVNLSAIFASTTIAASMQSFFNPTYDTNIACYGDSITEGAGSSGGAGNYPFQLGQLFSPIRAVSNRGIGGQVSTQIAQRSGGIGILLTFTGGVIPSSTTAVAVTSDGNPMTGTDPARNLVGWIRGINGAQVYGTLDKALNSTSLTFTRAVAGSEIAVDPDTAFVVDNSAVLNRFHIFGMGTNDDKTTPSVTTATLSTAIAALPAFGPKRVKRWGVMSVWGGNAATIGTAAYTNVRDFNRALQRTFPGNFIDTRGALMRAGDGSANDLADIASGILPRSKSGDGIHLNDAGYAVLAATVKLFIDRIESTL